MHAHCGVVAVGDENDAVLGISRTHFGNNILVGNAALDVEFEHGLAVSPVERLAQRRRMRIEHLAAAVAQAQRLELSEREVAHSARAVGRAVDGVVMHEDKRAVLGAHDVDLQDGWRQDQCVRGSLDRILRVAGRGTAAVRGDDGLATIAQAIEERRQRSRRNGVASRLVCCRLRGAGRARRAASGEHKRQGNQRAAHVRCCLKNATVRSSATRASAASKFFPPSRVKAWSRSG